jgi:hypothetical protein
MGISNVVSHQFWFSWFMNGVHKQVGQVQKLDKKVLHVADKILEEQWSRATTTNQKKRVAEMGVWFVGGFCTGLQGEEMLNIELAGTANNVGEKNESMRQYCELERTERFVNEDG